MLAAEGRNLCAALVPDRDAARAADRTDTEKYVYAREVGVHADVLRHGVADETAVPDVERPALGGLLSCAVCSGSPACARRLGGYEIDLIDKDLKALTLSKRLCDSLNLDFGFIHAEAAQADYRRYDLVFIASMIDEKTSLVNKLHNTGIKYLIVRDAEKFSCLFYAELEREIFQKYKISSYHVGDNMTLNSSFLLEIQ